MSRKRRKGKAKITVERTEGSDEPPKVWCTDAKGRRKILLEAGVHYRTEPRTGQLEWTLVGALLVQQRSR